MATKMGYFSSDDPTVADSGQHLNDSLNDSRFISGWDQPSIAVDRDIPPDSLPLFLTSAIGLMSEISQPPMPAPEAPWTRKKPVVASRILKAAVLAASAIAIMFGVLSRQDERTVVANASASAVTALPGSSDASGRSPASNVQIADADGALPPTAALMPTRAEITAAFQTALQGQPDVRQPPSAASPARHLDADELTTLLNRAKNLIATGDIASARLLLERAADAQEPRAALILAGTYDPAVLGTQDARSIAPDLATARIWYQKAAKFGSRDAQQRLDQMQD
jgi:hypothetical protein